MPTPRAEALAGPIREALLHIIISRDAFNPALSDRRFRIGVSDFVMVVFFQAIVERLAREAPGVALDFLPLADAPDELLQRGEIDFLVLPEMYMSRSHPRAALFEETLVCVGCRTNKQLSRKPTFEKYMSMGHVAATFGRTQRPPIEDSFLIEYGLKRRLEVVVQSFSMIPPMPLGTARIGTMPSLQARHFGKTTPLRIVDLPPPIPSFREAVQWPALHNNDPASIWMRKVLLEQASAHAIRARHRINSQGLFAFEVNGTTLHNSDVN